MTCPDEYLIDKIVPARRLHLLAGISSAGKSRFSLPMLIMWSVGAPIFGLESRAGTWCMVCGDRPIADAYDTLTSMGLSKSDVDIIPAFGKHHRPTYEVMEQIIERKVTLVLWEGFDLLVKNPNNPHEVKELLSKITSYCEDGLTIIGTVGVAKLKPHETYQNPRQLVAGSSLWERATSTNLIIMATHPGDIENGERIMYVCLKNSPSFAILGKFDDSGMLVFNDWESRIQGGQLQALQTRMRSVKNGNGS